VAAGGSRSTTGGRLWAHASARLAWSLCGLALALLVVTLLVLLAGRPPLTPTADPGSGKRPTCCSLLGRRFWAG
jgi:hypothetical protein